MIPNQVETHIPNRGGIEVCHEEHGTAPKAGRRRGFIVPKDRVPPIFILGFLAPPADRPICEAPDCIA